MVRVETRVGKDVKEERRCIFKMQRIFVLWLSNSKKVGGGGVCVCHIIDTRK